MSTEFKKDAISLLCKGIMTNLEQDIMPEGFFTYLQNTRIAKEGKIKSRPLIDYVGTLNPATNDLIHTIKKLTDESSGLNTHVIGAGTNVFVGALVNPTLIEGGFSGDKLS